MEDLADVIVTSKPGSYTDVKLDDVDKSFMRIHGEEGFKTGCLSISRHVWRGLKQDVYLSLVLVVAI